MSLSAGRDPLVELDVGLGQALHGELGPARSSPDATSRAARASSVRTRRSAPASAAASPGGTRRRRGLPCGHVGVAGQIAGDHGGRCAAMASSSTTPNDSPCSDGAQKTSAARIRSTFSRSEIRPSHSMRTSPATWRRRASVSGPSPATQRRDPGGQLAHGLQQHRQPLAGLVAAEEQDRGLGRSGTDVRLGVGLQLDPVEDELVLPARRSRHGHRPGVLRHRAAEVELVRPSTARSGPATGTPALSPAAWKVPTRGWDLKSSAVWVDTGSERLVEVHHVEALVAEGPDGAQLGRGVGGDRGHRAVRRRWGCCRRAG